MSILPALAISLLLGSVCPGAIIAINNLSGGNQGFAASLSGPTASCGFFGTFEDNGNAPVIEPGWTLGNTWYFAPDFGGSWTEVTSGPQARVELTVEAVPEPSTPLLGLVAAGMVLRRRRR